jgi:outer membrane protein
MRLFSVVCLVAVLCFSLASSVRAMGFVPFEVDSSMTMVGVGIGVAPDYLGSDDIMVGGAAYGRIYLWDTERYIQLQAFELSANLLDHEYLRLGPVLNYRFGRDSEIEDDKVKEMEEIDGTVEAGVFGGIDYRLGGDPRHRVVLLGQAIADVADEHDGYLLTISGRYWYPVTKMLDLGIGVSSTYGDGNYMDTYFGVDSLDAGRSGLDQFDADGGIRDISVIPMAMFHFSENWHLGAGAKIMALVGDASDSPVVDDRGSDVQVIGGIGIGYSW